MLQKADKDRLDKVLELIKNSGIRFPIAELSRLTGKGQGEVSVYLSGKKPMSDKFYSSFMNKYGSNENIVQTTEITLHNLINQNSELVDAHKELAVANKELAEANKELTIMLKNSINSNGQNSHQNVAEKVLHRIAEKGVPELWPSKEAGMSILSKYLIGAPGGIAEANKMEKAGKQGIS